MSKFFNAASLNEYIVQHPNMKESEIAEYFNVSISEISNSYQKYHDERRTRADKKQ